MRSGGFQGAAFRFQHGFPDAVMPRRELKSYLEQAIGWMTGSSLQCVNVAASPALYGSLREGVERVAAPEYGALSIAAAKARPLVEMTGFISARPRLG